MKPVLASLPLAPHPAARLPPDTSAEDQPVTGSSTRTERWSRRMGPRGASEQTLATAAPECRSGRPPWASLATRLASLNHPPSVVRSRVGAGDGPAALDPRQAAR